MERRIDTTGVIALLNDMFVADARATAQLVNYRVRCNEAIENHPSIVVTDDSDGKPCVGLIGVLNGLFGIDPETQQGPIATVCDDDGDVVGFAATRPGIEKQYFVLYKPDERVWSRCAASVAPPLERDGRQLVSNLNAIRRYIAELRGQLPASSFIVYEVDPEHQRMRMVPPEEYGEESA